MYSSALDLSKARQFETPKLLITGMLGVSVCVWHIFLSFNHNDGKVDKIAMVFGIQCHTTLMTCKCAETSTSRAIRAHFNIQYLSWVFHSLFNHVCNGRIQYCTYGQESQQCMPLPTCSTAASHQDCARDCSALSLSVTAISFCSSSMTYCTLCRHGKHTSKNSAEHRALAPEWYHSGANVSAGSDTHSY